MDPRLNPFADHRDYRAARRMIYRAISNDGVIGPRERARIMDQFSRLENLEQRALVQDLSRAYPRFAARLQFLGLFT